MKQAVWKKEEPYGTEGLQKKTTVKEATNGFIIEERICGYKGEGDEYYEEESLSISNSNPLEEKKEPVQNVKDKTLSAINSAVGSLGLKSY